jgi:broad specificity phosphatase PhoE
LDGLGQRQAEAVAAALAPLGPLAVVSSPLQRCQQTADPLASAWGAEVRVEPRVAEIPAPAGIGMGERIEWLRTAMAGTWAELGSNHEAFRDSVVAAVTELIVDSVVFSHFIAINAVIGAATGDDRVVIRRLDNCSVTVVEVTAAGIRLVEGGREADTLIR